MKRINKYLFLDVDGVLNSVSWYREEWNKDHVYPQGDFDPKCVEIVNRIVKETGCKVVVSSSWRAEANLQSIFDKAGLKFKIHSITPFGDHRGCEIRDWLASETEPYPAKISHAIAGVLYYQIIAGDKTIVFPIDMNDRDDVGTTTFLAEYPKPITLMRYIRKAIDSGELVIATTDAEV